MTQKSFYLFSLSFYALQHRLLSYLVLDMYVNRCVKLFLSVMLSSYFFFQLNVTTWFFAGHVFRHFEILPKIILSCQAVQFAFTSTRRRERCSPVSQILQLANLSSPRKEGLKLLIFLFDYHGYHCGDAWRM